jgi:hypothetical protein
MHHTHARRHFGTDATLLLLLLIIFCYFLLKLSSVFSQQPRLAGVLK